MPLQKLVSGNRHFQASNSAATEYFMRPVSANGALSDADAVARFCDGIEPSIA